MNIIDIKDRAGELASKYEKYLVEEPQLRPKSGDPFVDEYLVLVDRIQDLTLKAEEVALEKNRALKAALNAELRKDKGNLLDSAIPKLATIAKDMRKGSTQEAAQLRDQQVQELAQAVDDIPDGMGTMRSPGRPLLGGGSVYAPGSSITINPLKLDGRFQSAEHYQHTDQSKAFISEAEQAERRQNQALERIENGLGTLKELGTAMGEEIQRHDVIIDEVNAKMDTITSDLKTNNMRLKGLITKVRSSRNFCIDVILICVLLALGLYIYIMLK
ncbi:SYP71 [Auxenochlorella protothecoides x Auxenochlorella symbiontica]